MDGSMDRQTEGRNKAVRKLIVPGLASSKKDLLWVVVVAWHPGRSHA